MWKVSCGHRKWEIGINEDSNVVVKYHYHPGYMEITLCDSNPTEFHDLAKMFESAATYYEALAEVRKHDLPKENDNGI